MGSPVAPKSTSSFPSETHRPSAQSFRRCTRAQSAPACPSNTAQSPSPRTVPIHWQRAPASFYLHRPSSPWEFLIPVTLAPSPPLLAHTDSKPRDTLPPPSIWRSAPAIAGRKSNHSPPSPPPPTSSPRLSRKGQQLFRSRRRFGRGSTLFGPISRIPFPSQLPCRIHSHMAP